MKTIFGALLTATAHLSKILVGFVLLKLIAHYLGAEGLGQLGHFMSLFTILTILAGGGILNGVIKYVAEYREQPGRLIGFLSSAASYSAIACAVFLLLGVGFSKYIAGLVFGDPDLYFYVVILAVAQVGFGFINLVIGVCNGLGKTHVYAKIQVLGSLLSIPVAWGLIVNFGFGGAVLGLISSLLLCALPALYFYLRSSFVGRVHLSFRLGGDLKRLSSYTLMLIASALTFPIVEMLIRQHLIQTSGYHEAGLWQAAIRLSSAYAGLFSVFLAYCFMPLISVEEDKKKIQGQVLSFMLIVMAMFSVGALTLYLGRGVFIPLLLSSEFSALENLIIYQLIGDFFKVCAYVMGFITVAKAATRLYISAEIFQSSLFLALGYFLTQVFAGAHGVMVDMPLHISFIFWSACWLSSGMSGLRVEISS